MHELVLQSHRLEKGFGKISNRPDNAAEVIPKALYIKINFDIKNFVERFINNKRYIIIRYIIIIL